MSHGIDCNTDITAECGCIKAEGITFVGRYINRMERAEADHIRAQGLYIVSIYETRPTSYEYFSYDRGLVDAQFAFNDAQRLGQPQSEPIYFTVDYDASPSESEGQISQYFAAINKILRGTVFPAVTYMVGAYGNGTVLSTLQRNNQAQFTWLANARLWYGSKDYTAWNICQHLGGTICNISADYDESNGHGGGWK